jgi:hypothetical protein
MPTYSLSPLFNGWQGFNAAGQPLNLGTIEVYLAGTPTPTPTYTTSTGAVQNTNPIVLNNGFPPNQIWLEDGVPVKFIVKDAAGATISTDDNIASTNANLAALANTTDPLKGAGLIGFGPLLTYAPGTAGSALQFVVHAGAYPGIDWTGATDSATAFQALVDFCEKVYNTSFATVDSVVGSTSNNWLTLQMPAGFLSLGSTVRIKAPINFRGVGETATKIIARVGFSATSNNAVLDFSRADGHWLLSQEIRSFTVIDGTRTFVPLFGRYLHQYVIDDVACVGGSHGLRLEGSYTGRIGRISLYDNEIGGRIIGLYTPSTQETNDVYVERIEAYDNGIGLEVGGALNLHLAGVIQKTDEECIKVIESLQLLDIQQLYFEDWWNDLPDYSLTAYAVTTPLSGSSKMVNRLVMQRCTAVDNRPVVRLDQCLDATITDNYWHNSTTCVRVLSGAAVKTLEYKRNSLKRSGSAATPGLLPQEFFGYIVLNESATLRPELLASDFVTGNNATNPLDINFAFGFSGQIRQARAGSLIVDVLVPFALLYQTDMANLKSIRGFGPQTGFVCPLQSYIIDADGVTVSDLKISSSANTQDATIGDTATSCYVGGTFNAAKALTLQNVTFENTDATGVNAVEFGRLLTHSNILSCKLITAATQKAGIFSKDCFYSALTSDNDTTGTTLTNVQTLRNTFVNCPTVGGLAATGMRMSAGAGLGIVAAIPTIASATTVAPVETTTFVSGTTAVATITVPTGFPTGGRITLIPTGAWPTTVAGNIQRAVTSSANVPVDFIWDQALSKWWVK